MFSELEAFAAECQATQLTLAGIPAEQWDGPGLGEWTLAELAAHLVRGASRIDAYLDLPVDDDVPAVDRVEYFQFDLEAAAPAIAARAREEAEGVDPTTLADAFGQAWNASLDRAGDLPPDRLLQTIRGPMRLDEYTATRVLEMVVHHMDVCAAIGVPPVAEPTAARLTMALLEGLLGGPRPRNLGRARFILAATGRIAVDDPRFPVLR